MKPQNLPPHASFGDCAYQAMQKHFNKAIKYEAEVRQDVDPEPLHQMRVGMRRLRTALRVFEPAVDVPQAAKQKKIGKIARVLGTVRDADVMSANLRDRYLPSLKGKERKRLQKVIDRLEKQRRRDFAQMENVLEHSRYRKFKQGFEAWFKNPHFRAIAEASIADVLPDLMLPLISQLLLHPGWMVGTHWQDDKLVGAEISTSEDLNHLLEREGTELHELRKQMKRVRYQSEFFLDFYDSPYADCVKEFKQIQDVLGELQDGWVMKEFLTLELEQDLEKALPTLAEQFQQERFQLWQQWQPIQQRYLDAAFRQSLRVQVSHPTITTQKLEPEPGSPATDAATPQGATETVS